MIDGITTWFTSIEWTPTFITAQILGVITIILFAIAPQCKTKSRVLLFSLMAGSLSVVSFGLLRAWPAVGIGCIAILRVFVYRSYSNHDKKAPGWAAITFAILSIIAITFTWQGPITLTILLPALISIYTQWQNNLTILRTGTLIGCMLYGIYSFSVGAYVNVINEIILVTSAAIALWRYRKPKPAATT